MDGIRLEATTKVYPNGVKAIDNVTLDIHAGEFMVLVGPSGCGKSTLLRMIAGLEEVTEGRILIGDRDVTRLRPRDRDIAMVFQNYALYPQMTVEENLGFGLKLRRVSKPERKSRVDQVADTLGLKALMERRPAFLSGGQRQRVAMGRAMVREPKAFLMDEPLSNLDAKLRVAMRGELTRLHDRLGVTTVYVTHDQVEAMTLGPARRRHARRRPAAVRHAAEALPSAGKPLRGGIHGLTRDERRRSRSGRRAGPLRRAHRAARPGITSCRRQPCGHPRRPSDRSPASRRGTGRPAA